MIDRALLSLRLVAVAAAALTLTTGGPAAAQQSDDGLAAEAVSILQDELGSWDSRWERLDADGNVTSVTEGVETFLPLNGERVHLLKTHIPAMNQTSNGLRFYNPVEKRLMLISVGADGRHFILREEVGGNVVLSDPYMSRNGSETILRFTTTSATENEKIIDHEFSTDGGKSWTLFRRQTMTRRES